MYGLGGVALAAPLASALLIAFNDPNGVAGVRAQARVVERTSADGDAATQAHVERVRDFPAFAPEGVIVVPAPERTEVHRIADEAAAPRRAESARSRRVAVETASARTARGAAPTQSVASRVVDEQPRTLGSEDYADARGGEARPTLNESEAARREAAREDYDNRSWYRSPNYWRELERRRRVR
jgi:hypothetical protein